MPIRSKQTATQSGFYYNPLDGLTVNFFPARGGTTVGILRGVHPFSRDFVKGEKRATAFHGALLVMMDEANNVTAELNGEPLDATRYSVIFPKRKRKRFSTV